jgi:hypothetical protein
MSNELENVSTNAEVEKPLTDRDVLEDILSKKTDELHPWEGCTLPSKGLYYDGAIPNGLIEVKPMGLKAEKILTTQRLIKSGEALDFLFRHHVKLPGNFDPLNLLESDREFILYYLRGVTHGNLYGFVLTCPQCGVISDQEYDLNELYSTVKYPNVDLGPEPFQVILPYLTKTAGREFWVKIRFLRGRDAMKLLGANDITTHRAHSKKRQNRDEALREQRKQNETLNDTLEKNINQIIVEAMGETKRNKISALIDRMHSADISAIMEFLNEYTPGVDNSIETECGNAQCGTTLNIPLPITDEFFRPKVRRGT